MFQTSDKTRDRLQKTLKISVVALPAFAISTLFALVPLALAIGIFSVPDIKHVAKRSVPISENTPVAAEMTKTDAAAAEKSAADYHSAQNKLHALGDVPLPIDGEVDAEYERINSDWEKYAEDYLRTTMGLPDADVEYLFKQRRTYFTGVQEIGKLIENSTDDAEQQSLYERLNAATVNYRKQLEMKLGTQKLEQIEAARQEFNGGINSKYAGKIGVGGL